MDKLLDASGAFEAPHRPSHSESPSADVGLANTIAITSTDDVVPSGQPAALQPGTTMGQYQLIRELGRGGMSAVFLARDTRLGRRVAIKFLAQRHPVQVERFLAEARVTARCKHDNIVDIYDMGEALGHSYMVLEYLRGVTLRTWICNRWQSLDTPMDSAKPHNTPVSPTLAVELMTPVVRALAHAHGRGLVHRDLKPENVMLTDDGAIKVLDFGIAKVLEQSEEPSSQLLHETSQAWLERSFETAAGALVGTLPYMAPEQWRGETIDERTDIWAVGIMLFELCTGRHPLAQLTQESLRTVAQMDRPMPSLDPYRPRLGMLADVVERCLRKSIDERIPSAQALLDLLEPLLPGHQRASNAQDPDNRDPDNPFVGLAAFQRTDATRFFGRDRDIASMLAQLRNHRLVTVAGPSGAGKSSLVRAGVIPALERSGHMWETFIIRPGRAPLTALADILSSVTQSEDGNHDTSEATAQRARIDDLRSQPGFLGTALRSRCKRRHSRVLLFVDQFEELYTLGSDRATREAFVQCLEGVADDASSPLRVVLSVRSDFLDRMAEDRAFTSEIIHGLTLLAPLDRPQLRAALTEPLAPSGYRFEDETLIETMLDALEATRAPLPLLQFTAARLWDERDADAKHITQESYEVLGGVEGALASHADMVLASLTGDERGLARIVLTSLVSDERTRAVVSLDELRASVSGERAGALGPVVRHLAGARLVLMESNANMGAAMELIHESLIDRWPTLTAWLDEDQDATAFRNRLRVAARQWDKQGRSEDLLWRGEAAVEAERWRDRADRVLADEGERDRDYLAAVVGLAGRARRRQRRLAAAGFVLICAVAVTVSLLAVRARTTAELEQKNAALMTANAQVAKSAEQAAANAAGARNASRLASAALNRLDATLVLALLRDMETEGPLPPQWRELASWAIHQNLSQVVLPHQERVTSAAFSPDGTHIVTASIDKTVRVWNANGTGQPIILSGHQEHVTSAAFSLDGTRIVTSSGDKTARVWNADGTGHPIVLSGHQDSITSAAFDSDGARILTASIDKTVRVWSVDDTGKTIILSGHQGFITSAAFSPNSSRVVTASRDKTVRVWNADGTGQPIILSGHQALVYSATFSPDGTRILTASVDNTTRVWNADGTGQPIILSGHQGQVISAAFSPDGERVVTTSWDKTVRVWNADGTGQPIILSGHQALVYSATFSPDGTRILTYSADRTARVWNADGTGQPIILSGHQEYVMSAAFSPDGTRIATASADKTARVWNADGTGKPIILAGHQKGVWSAEFNPAGTRIVTVSADMTVRVWNADGTGKPSVLSGHQDSIVSAAFSSDGTRILTASRDRTVRVWNADGIGQPATLHIPELNATTAAFSPDGSRIVTASHSEQDATTGMTCWATIWPTFAPITGVDDPALWTATGYCPSVEFREELLGKMPDGMAEARYQRCLTRVAAAQASSAQASQP